MDTERHIHQEHERSGRLESGTGPKGFRVRLFALSVRFDKEVHDENITGLIGEKIY